MAFCTKCGAAIENNVKFCTACGAPVEEVAQETAAPKKEAKQSESVSKLKEILNTENVGDAFKHALPQDFVKFGLIPEFIGRVEEIADEIMTNRLLFFVGEHTPIYAEDYLSQTMNCSSQSPMIRVNDEDDAAIYFSSGTTGVLLSSPNTGLSPFTIVILPPFNKLQFACIPEIVGI